MSVVIIEDDEGLRSSLAVVLSIYEIDNRSYGSVEEFLAKDSGEGIKLLLLDQYLPGKSGTELLEHLRLSGRLPRTILVSARLTDQIRLAALAAGATATIDKPLEFPELMRLINAYERDQE